VLGAGGTAFTHTTTDTYAINTRFEIEMRITVGNSGSYTLKVDGVIPNKSGGGTMDQTGVDLQDGGATTCDNVRIGSETLDTYTDDEVVDNAGNLLGLGQVEALYPDGAGDLAEMDRAGADSGANWSQCDEAQHNSNTDYVRNTVADKRDCYNFQNRSLSGTPRAVQVTGIVTRNASGTFTFKFFCRIAGVNYDGATIHTATSAYTGYREVWNTNPATSLAWTDSDIDGAQFGIHAIDSDIRLTQLVVEVFVTT
jgi:hypothetical protein